MNDWTVLNSNFYSNGGVNFGLLYNKVTGDIQIKQRSLLGDFSSPGLSTLYQNGVWYGDALQITGGNEPLFTYDSGDILKVNPIETQIAKQLNLDARKLSYQAYITLGGNTKGLKINSTALPQNQNGAATTSNQVPGTNPGISSAIPGLSTPVGNGGLWDIVSPGLPDPGPFEDIPTPWKKLLKYPFDILDNKQDTLKITQFEYQSPNKDIFSKGDIKDILSIGIVRGPATKEISKGAVILPMPNNAADGNSVKWGMDTMDSMTTAATASAVQNLPAMGAGLLAAGALSGLANLANLPGAANLANSTPQIGLRLALLSQNTNNAALKAALQSYVLSKYGFEVSPESILARGKGIIPNSNLQLLFNNVSLRNFQFSYMMSPRNRKEAEEVNMILRFFKQGMAAKRGAAGTTLFLKTPNVFKLEYRSGDQPIKGINKFKICALTDFTVNYAPNNQWAAYEGGQPSSVLMTMRFQEIEPIFENDYKTSSNNRDNPAVQNDEIGY